MKSIRTKLWAAMMGFVVIILILLWLFQVVFLETYYQSMMLSRIQNQAMHYADQLSDVELRNALSLKDALRDEFAKYAETKQVGFEVINSSGETVFQQAVAMEPMFRHTFRTVFATILEGKTINTQVSHMRFESTYWVIGVPVVGSNMKVTGGIIITAPIESMDQTVEIIKEQLVYITLMLLVLASLMAFLLSKQFSKPILKISHATKKIAKGEYETKLNTHQTDEIGQLAKDIEEMSFELGQVDRLRKELIGNVSHELRTPLSIIRGYAETLRDVSGEHAEKRNHQLGIIISESERLSELIEDILNMSQIESGAITMSKQPFDLMDLVNDLRMKFEVMHPIEVISDQAQMVVYADRGRIEQVFYNLIGNAIAHTQTSNAIRVEIQESERVVHIGIRNFGDVLSEEKINKIWQRFYQVQSSDQGKPKGAGLGLAIVKSILESHKVKYGALSSDERGTLFWFELYKN